MRLSVPRGTALIFRFNCPTCGAENTATCRKCRAVYRFDPTRGPGEKLLTRHLKFSSGQWARIVGRAKILNISPAEYVRLSCADTLAMPPERLIS
jgi:hypothetical protein